jgi:hypothetical protein
MEIDSVGSQTKNEHRKTDGSDLHHTDKVSEFGAKKPHK